MTTDDKVVAGLQDASKRYDKLRALDNVCLEVRRGFARVA